MALLDFSDLLVDADLAISFSVIRRTETPAGHGRATITEVVTNNVIGIVTVGDSGNLLRAEDYSTTDNVITVSTSFLLRGTAENVQPDIILFDGIRYTVKALKRWGHIGTGFVKAVAVSSQAQDPPLA